MEGKLTANDFTVKLLQDKQFLNERYKEFFENNYQLEELTGTISSCVLNRTIRRALYDKKIKNLLCELLCYADRNSLTHANFKLLVHFPSRLRGTFLSTIAHKDLPFYQMQILNRYPQSYESFSWLFDSMCRYDCFSEQDIENVLHENKDMTVYGVRMCIEDALKNYGLTPKIEVALRHIKDLTDDSSIGIKHIAQGTVLCVDP